MKFLNSIKRAIHLRLFHFLPRVFGHLYPIYQHDFTNYQDGIPKFNPFHDGLTINSLFYRWKPEIQEFLDSCDGYFQQKSYGIKTKSESGHERYRYAIVYPLYFASKEDLIYFKLAFSHNDNGPVYDRVIYHN